MAKYEELIDDCEIEKRIRTIPEDMELTEYIKQRGGVDYPEEKADGGTVGIEILFEKKKDGGRVGFKKGGRDLDYQQRGQSKKDYAASTQQQNFSARDDGGANKVIGPIEQAVLKKLEKKIPKDDNPFKFLQGYSKTLPAQNRFFPMFRTSKEPTPYTSRNLLDQALTELNLSYPKLEFIDDYGFYNTENIKTAVDNAVLKGEISPIEGLNLTQSITTQGDPSAIGLSYDNSLLNFATPDISEGDYAGGINLDLANKAKLTGTFDVTDDALSKKNIGLNVGDGALKLSQTTYPGFDYQKNVVDLNKDLNLANNLNLNLRGNIENLRSDGSTFRTDQSLTPTLTYTGGIGDGTFKLSGSKEIVEGGSYPNVSFTGSFPIDQKTYIDADGPQTIDKGVISLKGSDLLSGDRSAVLGYDKTIGELGDNFYLDVGGQIDLTNPENYAGMLKLKKTFKDGGRVGLFMGGPPLTGQALAIYNSMNTYGATDQEIADRLQSLGLYTQGGTTTTPGDGIMGAQINQGRDTGPTRPTSEIVADFQETITNRQNKLNNPDKIASFVGDFIPQQRSIADMLASGQVDTRLTGGIPLGIGSVIAKALPDKYYDMSLADQITTQAYMGYTDPNTNIGNKDPFGLNVRSAFGNYAEKAAEIVGTLEEKLARKGTLSKYDQARLDHYRNVTATKQAAVTDLGLINLAKEQEAKRQADLQAKIQAEINAGKSLSQIGREQFTGEGQAFERRSDTFSGGKVKDTGGVPGGKYGSPRKDGGLMFARGGLATMFTRRR